ncbi:MAG: DUF4145 domain-containing protein [Thalassospira sp.]|uniref:DUF4145 domain-containing protein n=1 Tax=Thalassospira sp. TaxID=1912094 RepID=UPI0032EEE485
MNAEEIILVDCPHCRTIQAGCRCLKVYDRHDERTKDGKKTLHLVRTGFLLCPVCRKAIIAESEAGKFTFTPDGNLEVPEHLPELVERYLRQGLENVHRNFDAAGMMFRKSLEIALKVKHPELKDSLYKNIEKLAEDNDLTKDLAKWAHHIRFAGNDAAHEEEFSAEDAKEMQNFTELVLTYLFTLPEKVKAHTLGD